MGSSSKFHGLTGVESRRPKSNVAKRTRKAKLNAKKNDTTNAAIRDALKNISEVS